MKKIIFSLAVLLFAAGVRAQTPPVTSAPAGGQLPAEGQVPADSVAATPRFVYGYLSYDDALRSMADYALVQQQMDELRSAYKQELQRVEDEFNEKYEAFLDGRKDFPRTILLKRQTELQELLQQNIAFRKTGEQDLAEAEKLAMAPLRIRLNEAIATVARQWGLSLVVNTDSNACPFIEPMVSIDLNEEVKQKLSE